MTKEVTIMIIQKGKVNVLISQVTVVVIANSFNGNKIFLH